MGTLGSTLSTVDTSTFGSGGGLPSGSIIAYGGTSAPSGFLFCDGTSYLRTDYADLFTAIGTAYGAVDGTHFTVPELRQKFPRGKGAAESLGATGGAATHTHAGHSNHVVTQPSGHSDHAVTQPSNHASHTHTYTDVVNHVHVQHLPTGQTGGQNSGTRDTSTTGDGTDALSTSNPTGGVATGTTAGPGATITHSGTAVDAHSAHAGTAVDAHSAHDTPNSEPAYQIVNFIIKT